MFKTLICKIKGHKVGTEKYLRVRVYHTEGIRPLAEEAEIVYEFTCKRCGKYPLINGKEK